MTTSEVIKTDNVIATFPQEEREIGFTPKPKEDHSSYVECQACGNHKHWLNAGQVEKGDTMGEETLWFCNKNCWMAYKL